MKVIKKVRVVLQILNNKSRKLNLNGHQKLTNKRKVTIKIKGKINLSKNLKKLKKYKISQLFKKGQDLRLLNLLYLKTEMQAKTKRMITQILLVLDLK